MSHTKQRVASALMTIGLALGAGLLIAHPAAAANCTGSAFVYTSTVAQANSPKGCDNYSARARYTVSGSTAYSAFGTTRYESQYPGTSAHMERFVRRRAECQFAERRADAQLLRRRCLRILELDDHLTPYRLESTWSMRRGG